jgi:hypothetical protein
MFYKCRLNFRQTGMIFGGNAMKVTNLEGLQDGDGLAGAIRFDPHELANWRRKAQPVAFRPEDGNEWRRSA